MKKLLVWTITLAMVLSLCPPLGVMAQESYYTPTDSGYSGDGIGEGIYVGAAQTNDDGNNEMAPNIIGTTVSAGGMGIGKSEVALLWFDIDNTDPENFGTALLKVYASSVNTSLGSEWMRLAAYETDNTTDFVATWGEMDLDSIPAAVNNDYSYDAAMWSNQISASSLGWKTIDVSRIVKNALTANTAGNEKVTLVIRLQVPASGVDLSMEDGLEPRLMYQKERSYENYFNGGTLEFSGAYKGGDYVDTPVSTAWSGWTSSGPGVNVYDYPINGTPSSVLQFFHTVSKGSGDETNTVTAPTGGFGAGSDYVAFEWVLKRTAAATDLYHDYTFYDSLGVEIDSFRYDKFFGMQTDITGAFNTVAPMTEGITYRMIAVNNAEGTHNVIYLYSTDGVTYTKADVRENLAGKVSGFGSLKVFIQTWNALNAHTGLGDFKIYSGNMVDASATVVYKAGETEIGRSGTVTGLYAGDLYRYDAPLTIEYGAVTYIRDDNTTQATLTEGANEIVVNYVQDTIDSVASPSEIFTTRTYVAPTLPTKLTATLAVSKKTLDVDVVWDSDSIREAISSAGVKIVTGLAAGIAVSATVEVTSFEDSLILHYTFDGNTQDSTSSAINATVSGESFSYTAGIMGDAIELGGDAFVEFSNLTIPSDKMTVSFYARRSAGTFLYAFEPLTEKSSAASDNGGVYSGLFANDSRIDLEMHNAAGWTSGAVYNQKAAESWALYTIVYDGKDTYIYIDGKIKATSLSGAYSIKDILGTDTLYGRIGKCPRCWDANDPALTGALDDFKIYSTALSAQEIAALNTPISISVTTTPDKSVYWQGEKFNPAGMVVSGVYPDGTTRVITNYTYEPSGMLKSSDTTITVDVNGLQDTLAIEINESFAYNLSCFIEGENANAVVICGNLAMPDAKIVVAAYDEAGSLTNVTISAVQNGMYSAALAGGTSAKAFIWSAEEITPLAYAEN